MNLTDILFKTCSDLTGGLVTDIQTAIIAMLVIAFIMMGFDFLKEALEHSMQSQRKGRAYDEARTYQANGENATNQLDRDIARARYRDAVKRAS